MANTPPYPEFIKSLPQADLPMPGASGCILGAPEAQALFFSLPAGTEIPLHSHGDQWGIVVEGEMRFTIGQQTQIFTAGDSYYIPAGVEHGGVMLTDARIIEVFDDPERWKPRA